MLHLFQESHRLGAIGDYRKVNGTFLKSVPPGVTSCTVPLVAPVGTVVAIKEAETTLNTAAVPLKLTLVVPVRAVPES